MMNNHLVIRFNNPFRKMRYIRIPRFSWVIRFKKPSMKIRIHR